MQIDDSLLKFQLKRFDESDMTDGELVSELRRLIEPSSFKPSFVKGEIVEVFNRGQLSGIDYYGGVNDNGNHMLRDNGDMTFQIGKLKSLPIAMIPWDSSDRPEELEDDDLVLCLFDQGLTASYSAVDINWRAVIGYHPVTFLGNE